MTTLRYHQIRDRADNWAAACRLRIAFALWEGGEMCVCDLAQNLVSHPLKAPHQSGPAHSRLEGEIVIYQMSRTGVVLLVLLAAEPAAP